MRYFFAHPGFAATVIGKRELVDLLGLSSWCLVVVTCMWLFLAVSWVCLQFVIVVFHDHTNYFDQVIMTLHFLNDAVSDVKSTRKSKFTSY